MSLVSPITAQFESEAVAADRGSALPRLLSSAPTGVNEQEQKNIKKVTTPDAEEAEMMKSHDDSLAGIKESRRESDATLEATV